MIVLATMLACSDTRGAEPAAPAVPEYLGIQSRLIDWELVNQRVWMRGALERNDIVQYSRCAAAQYALTIGYGFVRHVRTKVTQEGGIWQADAVYSITSALPPGTRTIDAEVVVADCLELGIPTV